MVERDGDFEKLPDHAGDESPTVPVPADEDLAGYLLPDELLDPTRDQRFSPPSLPTPEEVQPVLTTAEQVAKSRTPEPAILVSAFQDVVNLLSRVDRELFEQRLFDQSPHERLVQLAGAASSIEYDLNVAQQQLGRLCSKNAEMVTHGFFQAVGFYLKRIVVARRTRNSEERQPEIVVLEDATLQNTDKLVSELGTDCWLAADRMIKSAGFSPTLPTLEPPPPRTDENDQPVALSEFSDGQDFLDAKYVRKAYMIRRDAPDAPKIDLGNVNSSATREDFEAVASAFRQVAIAELVLSRSHDVEPATSLALVGQRSARFREQLQPFESLRHVMILLAAKVQVAGVWESLEGVSRKAFVRLRNHKITATVREISDASVDEARAAYERAEKIRFKAAELMARNEHPDIKYVDDTLLKETAAYWIATELFDSGQIRETLEEAVQADFEIEPPTFLDGVVPPPDDGDDYEVS